MTDHPSQVRLGEMLRRRRVELDPRYRNRRTFITEQAPRLYRIVNDIELGRRDNYEPGTISALEAAYKLEPGSIAIALDGGDLIPQDVPPPIPMHPEAEEREPSDFLAGDLPPDAAARAGALAAELRGWIGSARRHTPDGRLAGADVFGPDDPRAAAWDVAVQLGFQVRPKRGFSDAQLADTLADAIVRAQESAAG